MRLTGGQRITDAREIRQPSRRCEEERRRHTWGVTISTCGKWGHHCLALAGTSTTGTLVGDALPFLGSDELLPALSGLRRQLHLLAIQPIGAFGDRDSALQLGEQLAEGLVEPTDASGQ